MLTNVLLLISPKIIQMVVDELERAWRSENDLNFVGPNFTVSPGRILFFALLIFSVALFAVYYALSNDGQSKGLHGRWNFISELTSFSIFRNFPLPITITSAPGI